MIGTRQPDKCDGAHNSWRDWSFLFLAYIAARDLGMKESMVLAGAEVVPVAQASNAEDQSRGRTLCYLLTLFLGSCAWPSSILTTASKQGDS